MTQNPSSQSALNSAAIIKRLGGPKAVGQHVGLSRWTVFGWYRRGIPAHQFEPLLRVAGSQGIDLSIDELFAASAKRRNGA